MGRSPEPLEPLPIGKVPAPSPRKCQAISESSPRPTAQLIGGWVWLGLFGFPPHREKIQEEEERSR